MNGKQSTSFMITAMVLRVATSRLFYIGLLTVVFFTFLFYGMNQSDRSFERLNAHPRIVKFQHKQLTPPTHGDAYCSSDCPAEISQMTKKLEEGTVNFRNLLEQLDLINPKFFVNSTAEVSATDVAVITASSESHISQAWKLCTSLMRYKGFDQSEPPKYILYDLGNLRETSINSYKEECGIVEFRDVHFDAFPTFVRNLGEFRWKPLLIAEALKEFKVVFYVDSSVTFYNDGNATFERYLEKMKWNNIPVALSSWSSHGIGGGTHPKMYEYLPIPEQHRSALMFETVAIYIATKEMKEKVLLNMVRCSLIEECMAPKDSQRICDRQKLNDGVYANCHRHDQSAINIILNLYTKNRPERYVMERRQWFVERGSERADPQYLAKMTIMEDI